MKTEGLCWTAEAGASPTAPVWGGPTETSGVLSVAFPCDGPCPGHLLVNCAQDHA